MAHSGEGLKLFVGGISRKTTDTDLRDYFENGFGPLSDFVIMKEPNGGESRGFGFVTFEKKDDYEKVIEAKKDLTLDGRRLDVKPALPKGVPVPGYKSRLQRMRERTEYGNENGYGDQNAFFGWAQQATPFYNNYGPGGSSGGYPPQQQQQQGPPGTNGVYNQNPMYPRNTGYYTSQYPQSQPGAAAPYYPSAGATTPAGPQPFDQAARAGAPAGAPTATLSPPMQHLVSPVPQQAIVPTAAMPPQAVHPHNPVPFQQAAAAAVAAAAAAGYHPSANGVVPVAQTVNMVHTPTPFVNPYGAQTIVQQPPRPVASPVPVPPSPSPSPAPQVLPHTPTHATGPYEYVNAVARPLTPQPHASPMTALLPASSPQHPHAAAAPAAAPNMGVVVAGAIGANQNIEVLQAQQRQLAEQLAQLQSQIVAAASVAISSQSVGRGGVAPVAPIAITAAAPISSTSVGVGQPTTAAVPTLPPTTMVGNGLNGTAAGVIMQQHQSAANASAAGTNLAASASGSDKGGYGPSAKGRGERASFRPY